MSHSSQQVPILYRAWINQPSTLQPDHDLHGRYCIVADTKEPYVKIYFTEGPVHSRMIARLAISRVK